MFKIFYHIIVVFIFLFALNINASSKESYPNYFEKKRWSTANIYTAWDTCRNNVNKWEWSNQNISNYHCSCLLDWQRPKFYKLGEKSALRSITKPMLKEKAELCFEYAKSVQDMPFGQGALPNDEETNRLSTSSILATFSGCFNSKQYKNKRYLFLYCGCTTDKLRNLYSIYGRKNILSSINNQKGHIWKKYLSSHGICESYANEQLYN